jgi:hypothetical protein
MHTDSVGAEEITTEKPEQGGESSSTRFRAARGGSRKLSSRRAEEDIDRSIGRDPIRVRGEGSEASREAWGGSDEEEEEGEESREVPGEVGSKREEDCSGEAGGGELGEDEGSTDTLNDRHDCSAGSMVAADMGCRRG